MSLASSHKASQGRPVKGEARQSPMETVTQLASSASLSNWEVLGVPTSALGLTHRPVLGPRKLMLRSSLWVGLPDGVSLQALWCWGYPTRNLKAERLGSVRTRTGRK